MQIAALGKQLLQVTAVATATFLECIDHVRARLEVDGGSCLGSSSLEHLFQFFAATGEAILLHLIAVLLREGQSANNVGGHERIALVVLPPSPTAVVMLVGVKTIQTFLYFPAQVVRIADRRRLYVLQRLRNNYVGEKTRHGLLSAAVRISCQVIQRPK